MVCSLVAIVVCSLSIVFLWLSMFLGFTIIDFSLRTNHCRAGARVGGSPSAQGDRRPPKGQSAPAAQNAAEGARPSCEEDQVDAEAATAPSAAAEAEAVATAPAEAETGASRAQVEAETGAARAEVEAGAARASGARAEAEAGASLGTAR